MTGVGFVAVVGVVKLFFCVTGVGVVEPYFCVAGVALL